MAKKTTKKKIKKPMGRPTKYKPEYCEMIIKHMAAGFSFESFAGIVEVHLDSLYEWAKKHPNFSEAKNIGFQKNRLFWENIGIQVCLGRNMTNASVWIFNMKNRFQWRDKTPEEDRDKGFEPIVIEMPVAGKTLMIDNKKKKG